MKLVIIEGAGKKETIEKYLGSGFRVFATKGHVRDLPEFSLGVDVNKNFSPKYTIIGDKQDIVKDLINKASKAEEVLLATDPDREGEAISWHLAHILNTPSGSKNRIVFNEISKKAIAAALLSPREIDQNLVDAQQARRVLDRLVGYKLSPILCKKIQSKLSAGRVQSVALRLVVDREREILGFKPEEYWNITALLSKLSGNTSQFKAALINHKGKKLTVNNEAGASAVLNAVKPAEWIVGSVKKSTSKSHAPAPFITSTLQQDALNKLNMTLKVTTQTAQILYEGIELHGEGKVALVTYIRTDSTRVSPDAQKEARDFISRKFGLKFVPDKPNFYKNKSSSQDAHEAIRPITLDRDPESIKDYPNKNVYRLYKLIYERFLASQMSEAVYDVVTADIDAADYTFRAKGKTPVFDGYTAVYKSYEEKDSEDDKGKLPELSEGEKLKLNDILPEQKFTQPPSRFTEASLVKMMEEKGIGRPATYTPTITTLTTRAYTEKDGKYILPTELGFNVTDLLIKYFPEIMDVSFTADMETKLDGIEEGGVVWQDVINNFSKDFEPKLIEANGDSFSLKMPPRDSGKLCPSCGSPMYIKSGKYGDFLGCSNYPKCKVIENLEKKPAANEPPCEKCGSPMTEKSGKYGKFFACSNYPECKNIRDKKSAPKAQPDNDSFSLKPSGEQTDPGTAQGAAVVAVAPCEKCGSEMIEKNGRFGKFYACSAYPACKNIRNISEKSSADSLGKCPNCSKDLRRVTSKKGTSFISCSGYPECNFMSYYPVVPGKCPDCGSHLVKKASGGKEYVSCSGKDCKYKKSDD